MTLTLSEDECWQAVQSRETSLSEPFFYAVRSTKIYCRPSCPSRRPNRVQVEFFAVPEDAEAAGYRACLRCRPRRAAAQAEAIAGACRSIENHIENHLDEALDLTTLSALTGLSPAHFQRVFRRMAGVSPREYAAACRMAQFKDSLQSGAAVTSALVEAGYGSTSRLYEQAPAQLGMTPTAYRRGGENMSIAYTITATPLGQMLVAATPKGICTITLGDSDLELEAALRREYPAAAITPDEAGAEDKAGMAEWVAALVRHLAGQQPALDLPLDVRATAFQRRVWQELQAIPYSETRSYTQVAEAIGRPLAARAVARACASNPVALAVPCHRVVRGSGELSGYRWGVPRKQALLEREKLEREKADVKPQPVAGPADAACPR